MILKNVSYTYKNKTNSVSALENINLTLPSKGLVFITGKSGSGKTTLLHLIGNILTLKNGEIENNNYDKIGFILQSNNLIKTLNVEENIILGTNYLNESLVDEITDKLKIKHFLFDKIDKLSEGEKQRVAIARCLYNNSDLILADEPTSSLDLNNSLNIIEIFKEISKEKLVVVVSHNQEIVKKYADMEIKFESGKITEITNQTRSNHKNDLEKSGIKINTTSNKKLRMTKFYKREIKDILNFSNIILFSTILIFFTLLLLFVNISLFDSEKAGIKNSYLTNDNLIYVSKDEKLKYSELKELKNNSSYMFYDLISKPGMSFLYFKKDREIISDFELNALEYGPTSLLELSVNDFDNLNLSLIAGEYPKNYNEVLITDYQFFLLKRNGLSKDLTKIEIKDFNDLNKYEIFKNGIKISGVVNTNIDLKYFEELFEKEVELSSLYMSYLRDIEYISGTIHNALIAKDGYSKYWQNNTIKLQDYSIGEFIYGEENFNISKIKGDEVGLLKNMEIGISIQDAVRLGFVENSSVFNYKLYLSVKDSIINFSKNNFDLIKVDFIKYMKSNPDYEDREITYLDYANYIFLLEKYDENIFSPGYNYDYFKRSVDYSIIIDDDTEIDRSLYFNIGDEIIELKITRIYEELDYRDVLVSEQLFDYLEKNVFLNTVMTITQMSKNYSTDIKLIEDMRLLNYKVSNRTINHINYNDQILKAYVGHIIKLIILTSVIILIYVTAIIKTYFSNNMREIGVLQLLGYSENQISLFYTLNFNIITVLSVILSPLISMILIKVINNALLGDLYFIDHLINFSILGLIIVVITMIIITSLIRYFTFIKIKKIDVSTKVRGV